LLVLGEFEGVTVLKVTGDGGNLLGFAHSLGRTDTRRSRGVALGARALVVLAAVGMLGVATAEAAPASRKTITINPAQVTGGPLADYPLLFNTTDISLRTTANGGSVTKPLGWDIMFATSPTCADWATCGGKKLDHEIERYNGTTGQLVAWVRVPSINNGTVIYIHYGDGAVAASTENRLGVWDANYQAVWHLSEAPANGVAGNIDSAGAVQTNGTPAGFAGTAASTTNGTGIAGGAVMFDRTDNNADNAGNNDVVQVADNATLEPTPMTFEMWVNANTLPTGGNAMLAQKNIATTPPAYQLYFDNARTLNFGWWNTGSTNAWVGTTPGTYSTGTWYHVAALVPAGTGNLTLYVNGVLVATGDVKTGTVLNTTNPLTIGNDDSYNIGFDGLIDEVRISSSLRTAGWLSTQYKNISSPSTFYSLSALNYRSIGTAANYLTGSIAATAGSAVVTGTGTAWRTANRGRGDRISINGTSYVVAAVNSNTQLTLTAPSAATYSGTNYFIARQFATLAAWETCVDFTVACPFFPVTSASLVADGRSEVGIAYKDSVLARVTINGAVTDATHTITLTTDSGNRHNGIPGAGVIVDGLAVAGPTILVQDDYVTLDGLEVKGGTGATAAGVQFDTLSAANGSVVRNMLIHNTGADGILLNAASAAIDIYDNIIYGTTNAIRSAIAVPTGPTRILNNTLYNNSAGGVVGTGNNPGITLINNIAHTSGANYAVTALNAASKNNLSGTLTGTTHSPGGGGLNSVTLAALNFANAAAFNFHILSGSAAANAGADLSAIFAADIDDAVRVTLWDMGADDVLATAVELVSFEARARDGAVELAWQTGSELSNLGFHLYRAPSADGPWDRLTSSLVPGLGSSPLGQAYAWLDSGLVNGARYHYRLEDVDTASVSTLHGPVSAVPQASAPPPPAAAGGGSGGVPGDGAGGVSANPSCPAWVLAALGTSAPDSITCTKHGDPDAVSLDVVSRDARGATLELRTGGFWALRETSGTVRVFVPGLDTPADPTAPALPLRRALVDAVVGKRVSLVSAEAMDLRGFRGLRPSATGLAEMEVARDGTVRPARRALAAPRPSRGYLPGDVARLVGTAFQGERKSAVVEISPVRFDGARGDLVLAGRVRVTLAFSGLAPAESGAGNRGRLERRPTELYREVLAQLHTTQRGLHAVRFEDVFPGRGRRYPTSLLGLQRQGQAVSFHVEPAGGVFGPGSVLYFYADRTASSSDYSSEVAYELVRSPGPAMGVTRGHPVGAPIVSPSTGFASFETNRFYQPGLLEAPDLWLWDGMTTGVSKAKAFTLSGVDAASAEVGRLVVELQGGSESGAAADHHVRLSVNGVVVGEATFAGKRPCPLDIFVPASLLRDGANELALLNVGDTGVQSLVFLDRFAVSYPQRPEARAGVFEGEWAENGTAEVGGLSGPAVVLDVTLAAQTVAATPSPGGASIDSVAGGTADSVTTAVPRNDRRMAAVPRNDGRLRDVAGTFGVRWLSGVEALAGAVRFRAEAGRRYLVVSAEGLRAPRVVMPEPSTLRSVGNQADYLLVAPRSFLSAAEPLLVRRASQGLSVKAVSLEEIAAVFGHGQPSGEAIRSFVSHAYHQWQAPSPRYVVLLGDATTDPQHFVSTSWASPLPALWGKTSYLWTAMDPAIGAVNGEDELPDLAIGRIPATTLEQAQSLVGKILAWEDSGQGLAGTAVLVADNPDPAGDFEADVDDIQASFLSARSTTTLKLSELGAATRPAILAAFDDGASLVSYVGHGGSAVWASENVLNSWDAPSLQAQSRQPLLLTMNCLNGYFVAPNFDSLSEALLKADGRGAIAAFSPSGLSLDGPAHQYHRAVMTELVGGTRERLGDAIMAAQRGYAQAGLPPELLSVYHLLGDPAMRIR
jgi:hypothetical protein